jgi:dipeptidyl aminopeptidase/acylaminoacyl peptidase
MIRAATAWLAIGATMASCVAPTPTPAPTSTPVPTATATATPLPTATPTPAASPTPDPFAGLTIDDLAARRYGGGSLQAESAPAPTGAFTRTLVSYPSDGLRIHGFVDEPAGAGPFPVVLVLHGYVEPSTYRTLGYTTRYADALAGAGYLAIHPNYRNHPPSDSADEPFRVGYAIDVLNLAAIVRQTAGRPGPLARADGERIALFGHSMGGGIAIRAITVDPALDAAVLYGAMNADERLNYERILNYWSGGSRGREELSTPEQDLRRISPVHHLDRIAAAVAVHHGARDGDVPPEWSRDLCARLEALGKAPECHEYPGAGHLFTGQTDALFMERVRTFLDEAFQRADPAGG